MITVKKIYLSILSLIMLTVVFGTITYAWIGLSDVNSIDGMWLTATSGNDLEISLDGVNFGSRINTGELEKLIENVKLIDVTSYDNHTFKTGGLRQEVIAKPNEHYLTFDLWFRTVEIFKDVFLVNNVNDKVTYDQSVRGTYVISRGVTWHPSQAFLNGPDVEDLVSSGQTGIYHASEAVRIGVKELIDPNNLFDDRDESELKNFIYDPSENQDRGFGKSYGAFSYFVAVSGLNNFRLPEFKPETIYQLSQFAEYNPYQSIDDVSMVGHLVPNGEVNEDGKPYYIGKIRINVWLEGWDADAFDAIIADRIKIQLDFRSAFRENSGINW